MPGDRAKTVIVIPCYNEALRLPQSELLAFAGRHTGIVLLLVNDGSTDDTLEVLRRLEAASPQLRLLALPDNVGKAEAVRQGVLAALQEESEVVGFWDADLATPLEEIPRFLDRMHEGGFQVVTGCRLARLGSRVRRKHSRHYLGRIFATVVSCLLRLQVYDTQCGAKIFTAEVARKIFARPFCSRWLFDVELLLRMVRGYGREAVERMVYEYPLTCWEDVPGSKLTWRRMVLTPFELWRIFRSRER